MRKPCSSNCKRKKKINENRANLIFTIISFNAVIPSLQLAFCFFIFLFLLNFAQAKNHDVILQYPIPIIR